MPIETEKEALRRETLETDETVEGVALLLEPYRARFERHARSTEAPRPCDGLIGRGAARDPELAAMDAVVGPIFAAALQFLRALETQKRRAREALEKVTAASEEA
jgi:hypothetical protein